MKKVIFVGGTAYSGSTLFHLILANDKKGFACGEIATLFRPWHPRHLNLVSDLKDEACQAFWKNVQEYGEDFLYEAIFDLRPDARLIVQSSKNPFWIRAQNDKLDRKGIPFRNILIWKTPLEFAHSAQKRKLENWDKGWLNYHRKYFSIIRNWRAVKYHDLVKGTGTLEIVCQYLGIPFFPGKEEFWNKDYCILGGNASARFHLQSRKEAKRLMTETVDENQMNRYRKIYYSAIEDKQLEQMVTQTMKRSQRIEEVVSLLNHYDVSNCPTNIEPNTKDVHFSMAAIQLRRLKYELYSVWGKYNYSPD